MIFEQLKVHQCQGGNAFYGIITETYGDVEKDGGKGSKLSKLVPKVFRKEAMHVVGEVGSAAGSMVVRQFNEDGEESTLKFFYKTKAMNASITGVGLETVDSPSVPKTAQFNKVDCSEDKLTCDTSHLKSKEGWYIALSVKDQQLKSVQRSDLMKNGIYALVTIFNTDHEEDNHPSTAIYFTLKGDDGKMYNYYLVPKDSLGPEGAIAIKKVCVDKLSNDEITEVNYEYLEFTRDYVNPGNGVKGGRTVIKEIPPPHRKLRLGSDVEMD